MVWTKSIYHIRRNSDHIGATYSSIYHRRAEDVSIEFVPMYNGQEPVNMQLRQFMGSPLGVWTLDDWHRIDNQTQTMLWLDHSISAWATTATQCNLNEYTAMTMLNTRSMSQAFRNWCENNGLNLVLNKYLEADGTIKPQYVTTDNGVEHDRKMAMSLHKWHKDK
eukprot:1818539-Amphidinium_carterae.2